MTTALIGEFEPPHDAVTLYNHFLLDELCATEPVTSADIGALSCDGLVPFIHRVRKLLNGADRLVFLSRCWDRPSLMHLFLAFRLARLSVGRIDLVLHTELFSFFGPQRSRHVGWPLLRACFKLADTISVGDEATAFAVRQFCPDTTEVRIEQLHAPLPIADLPGSAGLANQGHPVIVVACNPASVGLIEQGHAIAEGSFQRGGQRPLVVALVTGDVEVDDRRLAAVVRDPSPTAVRSWLATARLVIRPIRSMSGCPHPTDWFMVEQPRCDNTTNLDSGLIVLERSVGNDGDPPIAQCLADDVAAVEPDRLLLIGVFDERRGEEAETNRAIAAACAARGIPVHRLELPDDGFDGETTASFRAFVRMLRSTIRPSDAVVCLTQGYTRPSLLLLLTTALCVRNQKARLFLGFHRDLFDFFGKLRSRNAGLPLLFVTFSIAEKIYSTRSGQAVAREYSHNPEKFVAVSYPTGEIDIDLTDRGDQDDRRSATQWLTDYRTATSPSITSATVRRLTCDGVEIAPDLASCYDFFGHDRQLKDRLVVIRKGSTDIAGLLAALDLGAQEQALGAPIPPRKDSPHEPSHHRSTVAESAIAD